MNSELIKRLLDIGDTMMEPEQQRVLHGSMIMEMLAEAQQARDDYLADIQMLRERGHDFEPDQKLLTALSDVITALAEHATALFEGGEDGE
jgi:hypothetical protein